MPLGPGPIEPPVMDTIYSLYRKRETITEHTSVYTRKAYKCCTMKFTLPMVAVQDQQVVLYLNSKPARGSRYIMLILL